MEGASLTIGVMALLFISSLYLIDKGLGVFRSYRRRLGGVWIHQYWWDNDSWSYARTKWKRLNGPDCDRCIEPSQKYYYHFFEHEDYRAPAPLAPPPSSGVYR